MACHPPHCSKGPSINGTESVTATSGIIDLLPPSGLTCVRFIVEMCPMPRTVAPCFNRTCTSPKCFVDGLSPGTVYGVTAVCRESNGQETGWGNEGTLTTLPALSMKSAAATGPFTGTAAAEPQPSSAFKEVGVKVKVKGV